MNNAAKDNWLKLRELGVPSLSRLRSGADAETSKALKKWRDGKDEELTLSHGIHLRRTVLTHEEVLNIIYNKHRSQFLALDRSGTLQLYCETGKKEKLKCVVENSNGVLYATKSKKYVCWGTDNHFKILNDELSLCNEFSYQNTINNALYNESTHDVLTLGDGCLQMWMFRQGNLVLVCKATITDGLNNEMPYHAAIEPTSSRLQRCYVIVGRNINVYNIKQQTLIATRNNAHTRTITGILYVRVSKVIITSCQDGSIKTWNDQLCVMSVFVGHSRSVTGMTQYVDTSQLLSSSEDGSIRLWSLECNSEIDILKDDYPVYGVLSPYATSALVSRSKSKLTFWKISDVHKLFTNISKSILLMKPTTHPKMFIRILCLCNDGCVRIICPTNGHIITTSIGPENASLVDAVYSPFDGLLFMLMNDGRICTYSPKSNPCNLEMMWASNINPDGAICCSLCIYEYFAEDFVAEDKWDMVLRKAKQANYSFPRDSSNDKPSNGHTLLIGGLENGVIVVYDLLCKRKGGAISFSIQGHKGSITAMTSNPKCGQLVTAGTDKVVKVWRVFPFAQEALAPLMMLVINDQPTHVAYSFWRLCVVSQNQSAAVFTTSIYSTKENHSTEKGQLKHDCMEDHNEVITGLAKCEKLRLFATCSLDGSVRIWNESNTLRRIIKLNAKPKNIVFTSDRGDIIVSIGKSIHRIAHQDYLPSVYVYQMVTMSILDCPGIEPIAISSDTWETMTPRERHCMKTVHSLLSESRVYGEDLPEDEALERRILMEEKQKVFSKLSNRDNELIQMRDGNAAKRVRAELSEKDAQDAFQNYLALFYRKPDISLPIEDLEYCSDDIPHQISKSTEKVIVDRSSIGFFSVTKQHSSPRKSPDIPNLDIDNGTQEEVMHRQRSKSLIQDRTESDTFPKCRPSSAEGVTVLVEKDRSIHEKQYLSSQPKLITPLCSFDEQQKNSHLIMVTAHPSCPSNVASIMKVHKEASKIFEKETSKANQSTLPIAPDGVLPNSVVVALYKDLRDEPENVATETKLWQPKQLSSIQLDHINASKTNLEQDASRSRLRSFHQLSPISFQDSSSQRQFESPDIADLREDDSFLSIQSNSPADYGGTEAINPGTETFFKTEVTSISSMIENKIDGYTENSLDTNDKNTLPLITNKMPLFVSQFENESWFSRCFPPPKPKIFSEEIHTVKKFIELLLKELMTSVPSLNDKQHICEAVLLLCNQNVIDKEILHLIFHTGLHLLGNNDHNNNDKDTSALLQSCIQMVLITNIVDVVLVVEMMMMWISNSDTREDISRAFLAIGLIDPKHKFAIAMTKLRAKSGSSLTSENWHEKTRLACQEWLLDVISQHDQTINSRTKTDESSASRSKRGILKAKNNSTQREGFDSKQFKKISFVHANFTPQLLAVNPIEAINHFCQLQMEKDANDLIAAQLKANKKPTKLRGKKNTVLALPPIDGYVSLARLGDTHKSQCHPNRETSLARNGYTLPPIPPNCTSIISMAHCLSLHLNKININPFYTTQEPTLQISNLVSTNYKKYFIPVESYENEEKTL